MTGDGPDRLRVAQVITTLARGGAQATVVSSAAMADLGVDVTVLVGRDRTDEGTFWDDPALASARVVPVPPLTRRPAPLDDLRALVWLVRWLRAERPDVVHTHSSKAGVIGRLAAAAAGIPCAHTVHGWGPLHSSSRLARLAATVIERCLARLTDCVVVVSRTDLDRGLAAGIGRPERYRVIRSGIDIDPPDRPVIDRSTVRRELGLGDGFVVGMVARMAHPKDHATLVAAFARLAGRVTDLAPTLVLIGDGPQRAAVADAAAAAGVEPAWLGARSDGARAVAAFDVAVLSSRWEGMPRTVVEAAAAGVPVVASDVGGIGELIEEGVGGRLVPAGDVEAMAAALEDCARRPARYREMAIVARRRAEEFSSTRMRAELADLWFYLAAKPGRRPLEPGRPGTRRSRRPALR